MIIDNTTQNLVQSLSCL